jgi:hypothetical protein
VYNLQRTKLQNKNREATRMPRRTDEEGEAIRKLIMDALKDGADSPRQVQDWIGQNSEIEAPSIPTIAGVMRDVGYKPAGFKWEKKGNRS